MEQIINNLKELKPTINKILIDLWLMVKNQGLSFLLIAGFAIYQAKVNIEQANKISFLQQEMLSYLRADRIILLQAVEKNSELLQRNETFIERVLNKVEGGK